MEASGAGLWLAPEEFAAVSEKYALAGEPGAGDRLGRGSYGAVASAVERATGARVALKWLVITDADGAAAALRELVCLQGLRDANSNANSHSGVVQLRDAFCARVWKAREGAGAGLDALVLVTAAAFDDLSGTLARAHRVGAAVPAVGYARQLLRALAFLHAAGVAHLDVKPHNVLVFERGCLELCDFGLADVGVSDWRMVQTVWWRAPEYVLGGRRPHSRIIGPRALAAAADVWSAGCVIYELLAAAARAAERVLFPQSGGPAALFRARLEAVGPPPGATAAQLPQIYARLEARIEDERSDSGAATAAPESEDADFAAIRQLWLEPAPTLPARAAALVAAAPADDRPALAALAALLPRLLAFDPADRIRAAAALVAPPFGEPPADLTALDAAGQAAGARFAGAHSQFAALQQNKGEPLDVILRQIKKLIT
jgi:serine/threonine protein kinase